MIEDEDKKQIALTYFPNSKIIIEKDLYNRDRFIFILTIQ